MSNKIIKNYKKNSIKFLTEFQIYILLEIIGDIILILDMGLVKVLIMKN